MRPVWWMPDSPEAVESSRLKYWVAEEQDEEKIEGLVVPGGSCAGVESWNREEGGEGEEGGGQSGGGGRREERRRREERKTRRRREV